MIVPDFLKLLDQIRGVYRMRITGKAGEVANRLGNLAASPKVVAALEVVQPDSRLYQSLIKDADRTVGDPP